jgi:hypothetical protein
MESSFDKLADLLAADVDVDLLRRHLQLTPTQRLERLVEAQAFAEEARKARERAASKTPEAPR